jgi:murein DD-endopeptidase MepM/ murein hydrolase activator NlpD
LKFFQKGDCLKIKNSLAVVAVVLAILSAAEFARGGQKQQDELSLQSVVIPPAPLILKKEPDTVSIPKDKAQGGSKGLYEKRVAASAKLKVNSAYGYRRDPFRGRARFHSGLDIKARWGDPVGASQAGVVQFVGWHHSYGNLVIIDHGGGLTTHYAHLSSFAVELGQAVERGTIIGYAGSTGRVTSPHLHYEVRINGNPVDPMQPVALDPTSDYFKKSGGATDAKPKDTNSQPATSVRRVARCVI